MIITVSLWFFSFRRHFLRVGSFNLLILLDLKIYQHPAGILKIPCSG